MTFVYENTDLNVFRFSFLQESQETHGIASKYVYVNVRFDNNNEKFPRKFNKLNHLQVFIYWNKHAGSNLLSIYIDR